MNEFRDLTVNDINEANVVIVGIPYDLGCSCEKGASFAPQKIRELSKCLPAYSMNGEDLKKIRLFDFGDITGNNFNELFNNIYKNNEIYKNDKFNLFIGGDHSVSIPLEKKFIERTKLNNKIPVIIHIDAHPDICDYYDGSKNSHACTNMRSLDNGLETSNLVLIGIRGFEEQEVDFFKKHPEIKIFKAKDFNELGWKKVLDIINASFDDRHELYISYDIDANDPSFAPGTGTPEAFGLNSFDIVRLICGIISKQKVKAMDIVEVSPPLDCNDITSWLALKTIYEVFAQLIKK